MILIDQIRSYQKFYKKGLQGFHRFNFLLFLLFLFVSKKDALKTIMSLPPSHGIATLLSPIAIGDLILPNRVIMAPLTRGRAGHSRVPNDYMREYYEIRASAGLIIAEATAISEQGYGFFAAPGIYTKEHAEGWKNVVDAVHRKNGRIFLQLWHTGRKSHSSFHPHTPIVAPSPIAIPDGFVYDANRNKVDHEVPHELTKEEIALVIQDYRRAASLAHEAGFDGVEVHAANGYLIDEFLQSCSNHRTDEYGGSYENRFRFLQEVIEAVKEVYPPSRIGVRVSPNGVFSGMGSEDNHLMYPYVAARLSEYGLAYLHLMDGLWRGGNTKCPRVTLFDLKRHFNGPLIGNIDYTQETGDGAIRTGAVDAIAFGTLFLSNPDLADRFANKWPLNPPPPLEEYYGLTGDPKENLKGYLTYRPYLEE